MTKRGVRKSFVRELKAELNAMREGRAPIEEYTGQEAGTASTGVHISVSKATYRRLEKLAKQQNVAVSELIDQLSKKQ